MLLVLVGIVGYDAANSVIYIHLLSVFLYIFLQYLKNNRKQ